jgi:rRNA-processing protein FCF1
MQHHRIPGLVTAAFITACSSFLHLEDPNAQAVSCAITSAVLPEIEAIAASFGFPVSVIEALYAEGCAAAAKQGKTQDEAQKYALAHARTESARFKKLGAHFEPEVSK